MDILRTLEKHYGDMQDTEFTVEEGQLYMLQTRNAKRPAQAAVRFARDAVDEGLLDRDQALMTDRGRDARRRCCIQTFDPNADYEVHRQGRRRRAGRAPRARSCSPPPRPSRPPPRRREPSSSSARTPTPTTSPASTPPRASSRASGGKASHAALVARGMGVPCVTARHRAEDRPRGARDPRRRPRDQGGRPHRHQRHDRRGHARRRPARRPTEDPAFDEILEAFETVLGWADDVRRLGVRANADTPHDADKARELGAEGIGLCRTEHMFMAEDRQPKMRTMIMADTRETRRDALAELLPLQQEDFEGLFEAMKGLPVTIRLLDPPLHEFLPDLPDLAAQVERARIECTDDLEELEKLLATTERDLRGEPDARHARLPARDPLPRDLRDAGPRDHAGGEGDGRAAAPRDHDPARRLRAGARDHARAGGPDRRRGGAARGRGLHRRDHDRAPARVFCCRSDRRACGLLLFRHK